MAHSLRTLVFLFLAVYIAAAPGVGQTVDGPVASDLVDQAMQQLGYETTVYARAEVALHDEFGVQRFEADMWWLPDGLRRVEFLAPESARGAVVAIHGGRSALVQSVQGVPGIDLASVALLFTIADDLLAPMVLDAPHWREAIVVLAFYGGRPVFELHRTNLDDDPGVLVIDAASNLPLAIRSGEGPEQVDLVELQELRTNGMGEVTQLVLELTSPGIVATLQLERIGAVLVPTRVSADVSGIGLEVALSDVRETRMPDELSISADMVPMPDPRFVQASEFTAAGQFQEAAVVLESLTRDDPYHIEGHIQLGYVYLHLGDLFSARASFEQALVLDPSNLVAANNLAYVLIDSGIDVAQGVLMAREVTLRQPSFAAYLDTYGWGLFQLEAYEEAVAVLASAVEYARTQLGSMDLAIVLSHYAEALSSVGRVAEAWDAAQEGLALDPTNADLRALVRELSPL